MTNELLAEVSILREKVEKYEKAIEDIKAKIQKALDEDKATDTENAKVQAIALMWCLEIIDKYIGEEI